MLPEKIQKWVDLENTIVVIEGFTCRLCVNPLRRMKPVKHWHLNVWADPVKRKSARYIARRARLNSHFVFSLLGGIASYPDRIQALKRQLGTRYPE